MLRKAFKIMGSCVSSKKPTPGLNHEFEKLLTDFNTMGPVPHFTVLGVCEVFKKTNGVEAQLDIVWGRLEYAGKELEQINEFAPGVITEQFKTKASLMQLVSSSREKLVCMRIVLKEVLEGKQMIERTIEELKMKNVHQAEWLLWMVSVSDSNLKGATLKCLEPYVEKLPNLRELTAGYNMQISILEGVIEIVTSVSETSEQFFHYIEILKGRLLMEGKMKKTDFTVYSEPKEITVPDFDYYGYSSVAPIVPPLDLSWLKDKDREASKFARPTLDSVSASASETSAYSQLSWQSNDNKPYAREVTPEKTESLASCSISSLSSEPICTNEASSWAQSSNTIIRSTNHCPRSETYLKRPIQTELNVMRSPPSQRNVAYNGGPDSDTRHNPRFKPHSNPPASGYLTYRCDTNDAPYSTTSSCSSTLNSSSSNSSPSSTLNSSSSNSSPSSTLNSSSSNSSPSSTLNSSSSNSSPSSTLNSSFSNPSPSSSSSSFPSSARSTANSNYSADSSDISTLSLASSVHMAVTKNLPLQHEKPPEILNLPVSRTHNTPRAAKGISSSMVVVSQIPPIKHRLLPQLKSSSSSTMKETRPILKVHKTVPVLVSKKKARPLPQPRIYLPSVLTVGNKNPLSQFQENYSPFIQEVPVHYSYKKNRSLPPLPPIEPHAAFSKRPLPPIPTYNKSFFLETPVNVPIEKHRPLPHSPKTKLPPISVTTSVGKSNSSIEPSPSIPVSTPMVNTKRKRLFIRMIGRVWSSFKSRMSSSLGCRSNRVRVISSAVQ
ncbi:hypothetical protein ScPMuIL_000634 [Solemya velum]